MDERPIISVLMPVYNSERYVAGSVESVLRQTLPDFEFIIVDDGSTDRSLEILRTYAAKDSRIRLTSRENKGVARTRNEMLVQARGEFIAVMDADDIALPERFALQVSFLRTHPEVVCIGGAYEIIDEVGRLLTCLSPPRENGEIQQQALAGHGSICHSCAMIRRSSLLDINGYDEAFTIAPDLDLWLRLGEIGELVNLKEPILKYRIHTNSISGQNPVKQRDAARIACERAWKRRGIEGHFEAIEPWRPGQDSSSQHKFMLQYGWWAFYSNQRKTAIFYGIRALVAAPYSIESWKLLVCAASKPFSEENYEQKAPCFSSNARLQCRAIRCRSHREYPFSNILRF